MFSTSNVSGKDLNYFIIGDLQIPRLSYLEILTYLENQITNKKKTFCVTINTDILRLTHNDPEYYNIVKSADLIFADGMPVVWLSKLTATSLPERTSGYDIVNDLFKLSDLKGYKIFILGAPNGALKAKEKLEKTLPNVKIAGIYSPTLEEIADEESNTRIINMINDSGAEIVFIALGAPRQEKWVYDNLKHLNPYIYIPCGGSIDCIAGVQKKSPQWISNIGFEWLYRLMNNPKRLFKRYVLEDLSFLVKLTGSILKENLSN